MKKKPNSDVTAQRDGLAVFCFRESPDQGWHGAFGAAFDASPDRGSSLKLNAGWPF
jgi:hypothetical protein